MSKTAHITSRPRYEVGDRVLGLCGEEFKVKQLWDDVPVDKPICRACVDTGLKALTEADALIEQVRSRVRRISMFTQVAQELLDEDQILDEIHETDQAHQDEVAQDKREKTARKLAKKTCTCTWTSQEVFEVDSNCPIHGGERTEEIVELPEEK